jgi:hypothetical protein
MLNLGHFEFIEFNFDIFIILNNYYLALNYSFILDFHYFFLIQNSLEFLLILALFKFHFT